MSASRTSNIDVANEAIRKSDSLRTSAVEKLNGEPETPRDQAGKPRQDHPEDFGE
ncbi:MAG: hypothetical protein AABZ63_03015 [Actinomycetota bacterium]